MYPAFETDLRLALCVAAAGGDGSLSGDDLFGAAFDAVTRGEVGSCERDSIA